MTKIRIIFLILIINFVFTIITNSVCFAQTEAQKAVEFCANGDKILDYYEQMEDKSNPNRYLNAAKYYYYQASRLDLSNPNSLIGHARVALYQNRLRDAKNVLMIALNFNEQNPRVNFYLGETFYADGEYTQAIDFYIEAYKNGYKTDYRTNYKLGVCYEKLNDIQKAKHHYTIALKTRPNDKAVTERMQKIENIKVNKQNFASEQNENKEQNITQEDFQNLNMPNPQKNNTEEL